MVCVIGEALIDLVLDPGSDRDPGSDHRESSDGSDRYTAHPGGSPYNVAIGLARLGQPSTLLARLSDDAFGRQLRRHAVHNGVDLSAAVAAPEPTTLAVVGLDEQRNAVYDFYLNGTADWQWTAAELDRMPADTSWIHTGSLASWTAPGAPVIEAHLTRRRAGSAVVVSYDPNIRPRLMPERDVAVVQIERMIALADVVKASAEDLEWLYPGVEIAQVLATWRKLGPALVVVTEGSDGAHAMTDDDELFTVPARRVAVVDTVGAGDAFMAGLINALARSGLAHKVKSADSMRPIVAEAILVAALTCARAGANPPTASELAAAR